MPIPRAVCPSGGFLRIYSTGSSDPGMSHQSLVAGIVINQSWRFEFGEKRPVYQQVESLFPHQTARAASVVKLSGAPDSVGGKTPI